MEMVVMEMVVMEMVVMEVVVMETGEGSPILGVFQGHEDTAAVADVVRGARKVVCVLVVVVGNVVVGVVVVVVGVVVVVVGVVVVDVVVVVVVGVGCGRSIEGRTGIVSEGRSREVVGRV